MPNGLIPQMSFMGEEGIYSEGDYGPEALKKDLSTLSRMFNPNAVHIDENHTQGGIGPNNIQPGAIANEHLSETFTVTSGQISDLVTTLRNPGEHSKIPSEKAVRDVLNTLQLSAGQFTKYSGLTLPADGWIESDTAKEFELSMDFAGVTESNSAKVDFAVDSLEEAMRAGISVTKTYNGGVTFYADKVPTTPLSFDMIIF